MSRESSSDCAYTIPHRGLGKLGLTAFAEVSEALSSEALFAVERREGNRGMGLFSVVFIY